MNRVRRSLLGAAVAGVLACLASVPPPEAAEPAGAFRVGDIWKGAARFGGPNGGFTGCYLDAYFPERLELSFLLDTKGVLSFDLFGPGDMAIPGKTAPATLSVDGRALATLAMNVDEEMLDLLEELSLYADLGPASSYLPALKAGKTITFAVQGQTMEKPPKAKTWTYTAALTRGAEAFQALEACVAKHAGTREQAAAPPAASAAPGVTAGSTKNPTGAADKAERFGAIAVGEDDEGLISGISNNHASPEAAGLAAIEACESKGTGSCQVRATMKRSMPCGAIAAGEDFDGEPVYGWATGPRKAEAELDAMKQCSRDAAGCTIRLSRCLSD